MSDRDSIVRLTSLMQRQFSAQRFTQFIRYSWYRCGYTKNLEINDDYGEFEHPVRFAFDPEIISQKCSYSPCLKDAFIRCSRCELVLCFDHFYHDFHYC